MIAAWMASAILVGACATIAALAADRLLANFTRPTRFVWLAAIVVTTAWPIALFLASRSTSARVGSVRATTIQNATDAVAAFARATVPFSLDTLLLAAWVALTLACAIRLAWGFGAIRVRQWWWEARTINGTRVWASNSVGPAVVGLRPMRIVVPKWVFELEAPLQTLVFRHEAEHVRARDPYLVWCAAIAAALMPWNPALWTHLRQLRLAIELDCDARVLRGHPDPERYGTLLLALAQRNITRAALFAPALWEPRTNLERRIAAMTTSPRSSRIRLAALAIVGAGSIALGCSVDAPVASREPGAPGAATGGSRAGAGGAHYEFQVEAPATQTQGVGVPVYPTTLKNAGFEGKVLASFVVNVDGSVDASSFKVISSSHDLFSAAVRNAVPSMRFQPARVDGRAVRQLVQIPFEFTIK